MRALLDFAEGPLFRFAIALMILGLGQRVFLSVAGFVKTRRKAGPREISLWAVFKQTVRQVSPLRFLARTRGVYTFLTMAMHVGLIIVPIFLAGHIYLLYQGTGVSWPHLPMVVADVLTLITLAAAVLVVVARLIGASSRAMGRFQDWFLPILIAVIFASGYFMAHPRYDFLPYPAMRLVHVLGGDLLLVLIPFTKIVHMVTLPFSQLAGEMGWRFVPGAGERVKKTLGKEGQPV